MSDTSIDEFWARIEAERANRQARLPEIKTFVLDQLRQCGVHSIEIEYDGEGDSGQTNGIIAFDASRQEIDLSAPTATPPGADNPLHEHLRQLMGTGSLYELVDNFTWEILGAYHDGFWNNDGGFGTLTIDVEDATVSLEHNDRYVEFNTTATEV